MPRSIYNHEFLLTLRDEIPGGSCRTTHQRCGFAIPKTHAKPAVIVFGRVRAKKFVSSRIKAIDNEILHATHF